MAMQLCRQHRWRCALPHPLSNAFSRAACVTPLCRYARLCVLPVNTPAPASTLAKLWQGAGGSIGSIDSSSSEVEVKASLAALAALGVLSVAQLPDGRVWCLPQPQQLELLQVRGGGEGRG